METEQKSTVNVFDVINNPEITNDPTSLIFSSEGVLFRFVKFLDEHIVIQPCTKKGEPDPVFRNRLKIEKNKLFAEDYFTLP